MSATAIHGATSGATYIDGILWSGWKWTDAGGPVEITYYFADYPDYPSGSGVPTGVWHNFEKAGYRGGAATWANVANLQFTESAAFDGTNFIEWLFNKDQMETFAGQPAGGAHDTPEYASTNGQRADGGYSYQIKSAGYRAWIPAELAPGACIFETFIHEIGHGLGLKHPFNGGGDWLPFPGVTTDDPYDTGDNHLNFMLYTVMAYAEDYGFDAHGHIVIRDGDTLFNVNGVRERTYGMAATPMAFDIAAIQYLYGAKHGYHTGNDIYVLPNRNAPGVAMWKCIWDAGGSDEIRYGGARNTIIDLTAATLDDSPTGGGVLSYAAFICGGFTIAHGVVIEKVSGGSGKDVLSGNAAANTLAGNGGADVLTGRLGKDTLNGGQGADVFDFNAAAESRGATADTIVGFSHAQHDRIDLRTIDAMPGGDNDAFAFIGTKSLAAYNAHHSGGAVHVAGGVIQVDIGGNNTIDMTIKIPGMAALVATDFFL